MKVELANPNRQLGRFEKKILKPLREKVLGIIFSAIGEKKMLEIMDKLGFKQASGSDGNN